MLSRTSSAVLKFHHVFLLTILVFCGCSAPVAETQPPHTEQAAEPNAGGSSPAVHSNAVDPKLASEIDHLIDDGELASARWGMSVVSLKDNRVVYERNADKLLTPASNMKLFPTAVALEFLGADYRWRTSVYAATSPDAAGNINGDLVLYGRGAPDLTAVTRTNEENRNSLDQLASDLYNRGVRRIRGNVIGDESYFRGNPLGDGWQWNDIQWYYGAEASALTINHNETSVNVLPPKSRETPPVIRVGDPTGYVTVENKMALGAANERMTLGIQRGLSDNVVLVWGTFPPGSKGFGARLSVHKPALWAAKMFLESLKARGITVDGQALTQDANEPVANRFDPQQASELAFVFSKPLREIIKATNKESINLYAELILRTLGRERAALLSTPVPGSRELGDDEVGLAIIRLWLNRAQVPMQGVALHDGSGLSRLNLVAPRTFVQMLAAMQRSPNSQIFRESLPLSGRDGTLGYRLKDYAERVSAKTGYITYDAALSGYVTTSEAEVFAFSIICNDETGRPSSGRLIDRIVSALASYPASTPEKAP
jgi:serine-type D-Ala-D-Ala carboxypeptidase/endopeptidase (penicillin-binding protein 4)